jgi:hypothetical protein
MTVARPLRLTTIRLAAATGATALLAVGATGAGPAPAIADTLVHAKYKVTGSTHIAKPDFTLALGPGTLRAVLHASTGRLTARLSLPDATGSFKQAGLVPVTATTQFINDGPTVGKLNLNTGAVRTTSKITLRIVRLIIGGLPVPVGRGCETRSPVVVTVRSQRGFNVLDGGRLAGHYTIGKFHHCLLATVLINLTLPGSGNSITLKLGKAKIG